MRRPPRHLAATALLALALAARAGDRHPLDASLIDERGREVRFHDDLVKGRVVAINFIFTRCTSICLPMSGAFARAEALLKPEEAKLISISIDPEADGPAQLAAWKEKLRGGPGWTLLTGPKEEIDRLGKALGAYSADRSLHSPTVIVLDGTSGRMVRVNGLTGARAIVDAIRGIRDASRAGQEAAP